jgi:ribulose-5-phosphate 4-epimerase/fuculose-1-phosphate aldolase
MTPEHAALVSDLKVVDFALPGEESAGVIGRVVKQSDLIGIRNHGFFSLVRDLHSATSMLEVIEESAKIHLIASQFGKRGGLDDEQVRRIRETYGRIQKEKGGTLGIPGVPELHR